MMRSRWTPGVAATIVLLGACDSSAAPEPATRPSPSPTGTGTVVLRLEKIDGFLTEGFKLKVRLEAPPGHEVLSSTWVDLLRHQGTGLKMPDFYKAVVRTPVPPGPFTFWTDMHPGMEPEQPTCVTRGQVGAGGVATVTVKFTATDGCSTLS